jgi:hypothetical protein
MEEGENERYERMKGGGDVKKKREKGARFNLFYQVPKYCQQLFISEFLKIFLHCWEFLRQCNRWGRRCIASR